MTPQEQANKLRAQFSDLLSEPAEFRGEVTLKVGDANRIADVCSFAKQTLGFDYLVDISSVDNYGEDPRFTLVYELYSYTHRTHLRLKIDVGEEASEAPTVSGVWKTADWHEREVYDLSGVYFTGHPNLRRILCPEDWVGHPLRKDYEMPLEYHGIRGR